MIKINKTNQTGFTIIELMIATVILSVVILMVTVILTSIGSLYYKGINESRIQDNTRGLSDEISQKLKFSGGLITPVFTIPGTTTNVLCVGDTRYFYVTGVQIGTGSGQSPHVLWRDVNPIDSKCDNSIKGGGTIKMTDNLALTDKKDNGVELMAPRSRLVTFSVAQASGLTATVYDVDVKMAYGDDDLLCSPDPVSGNCTAITNFTAPDLKCRGSVGDQFCATAELTTSVYPLLK